ncbi:MAG: hypothetical protein RSA49_05270 [Anaerovoracaceae bacterium]
MKKKSKIIISLAIISILIVGGVVAYYFNAQSITNRMKVVSAKVNVSEEFDPTEKWLPGEEKVKRVTFENEKDGDKYVRFSYELIVKDNKGNLITKPPVSADGQPFAKLNWAQGFDSKWKKGSSQKDQKYFYYQGSLTKGANTGVTLSSITMADWISNDDNGGNPNYEKYRVDVKVHGEMIPANKEMAEAAEWSGIK